jgi:carbonic anhydrase
VTAAAAGIGRTTGFESDSRDEPGADGIESALARNRAFAAAGATKAPEHAVLDPAATVTRDVERLRSAPAISPRVSVSGHDYDVVTGLVQTVIPARGSADRTR